MGIRSSKLSRAAIEKAQVIKIRRPSKNTDAQNGLVDRRVPEINPSLLKEMSQHHMLEEYATDPEPEEIPINTRYFLDTAGRYRLELEAESEAKYKEAKAKNPLLKKHEYHEDGRITIENIHALLAKRRENPKEFSAEVLAKEFSLDKHIVQKIVENCCVPLLSKSKGAEYVEGKW